MDNRRLFDFKKYDLDVPIIKREPRLFLGEWKEAGVLSVRAMELAMMYQAGTQTIHPLGLPIIVDTTYELNARMTATAMSIEWERIRLSLRNIIDTSIDCDSKLAQLKDLHITHIGKQVKITKRCKYYAQNGAIDSISKNVYSVKMKGGAIAKFGWDEFEITK